MNQKNIYTGIGAIILLILIAAGTWAAWYTYGRHTKIVHNIQCDRVLSQASTNGVNVLPSCVYYIVPPTLWAKLTRQSVGMQQSRPIVGGCDQSATTTACSTPPVPSQPEPQPYVPPNSVQPSETWVSTTGTPISLFGFSFELPSGWLGSVYSSAYTGSLHALVQNGSNNGGFTIDCPSNGKGLEAATRLSSEQRSFTSGNDTGYSVIFEKWTAPGNDPRYFIWMRALQSGDSLNASSGTYCLVQGTAIPDTEKALRTMYESLK